MAVNHQPTLRRAQVTSKPGQSLGGEQAEGQARKGKSGRRAGKGRLEGRGGKSESEGRAKKSAKKSETEKLRRDTERIHLERMCSLFKAPKNGWTRTEALSLGETNFLIDESDESLTNFVSVVLFRLYGPEAFAPGFVVVRPAAPAL